jgi:hypothetical protein
VSRSAGRAVAGASIAVVVYAAAVPWIFRPWFLTPDSLPQVGGSLGAISNADLHLNLWILAWVARAAVLSPAHLFDGNVFHPAMGTITGSENMLAHLPVTVPALAVTGNALVVLKAMAVESFVAAGVAMFLFVYWHTRDALAAFAAGALYTFTPMRAHTLPQPQYLGTQYMPLALLAVDCWLAHRRARALVGLALALALQAFACVYLGYFALLLVPLYALVRVAQQPAGERARAAGGLVLGGLGTAVALVPLALPYARARTAGVIPPCELDTLALFSFRSAYWLDGTASRWLGLLPAAIAAAAVIAAGLWIGQPGVSPAPRNASVEALPPEQAADALHEMELLEEFNRLVRSDLPADRKM